MAASHSEMQFHALVPEGHIDRAGSLLQGQSGVWDASRRGIARRGDHRAASSDTPTAHATGGPTLVRLLGRLGITCSLIRAKGLFSRRLGQTEEHVRRSRTSEIAGVRQSSQYRREICCSLGVPSTTRFFREKLNKNSHFFPKEP
jgi:hypothetical protein